MRRSVRCRLGVHSWRRSDNGEGQAYLTCRRCGREDDPGGRVRTVGPAL